MSSDKITKRGANRPGERCGAKARTTGKTCRSFAVEGSKRCRMHGGKTTTRGNKFSVSPGGIYSKYLSPDERIEYDKMELGSVDEEIKLMRTRLQRFMREEEKNEIELETRIERAGGGPATVELERHYKHRDWKALIAQTAARIESLEKTRAELLKLGAEGDDDEPESQTFTFEVVDGRKEK